MSDQDAHKERPYYGRALPAEIDYRVKPTEGVRVLRDTLALLTNAVP